MGNAPKILLTGFGSFPGVANNASARFAKSLAEISARRFGYAHVVHEILETQWVAAPMALVRLRERHRPDVILHFGVSERARGFVLEQEAHNVCDASVDACGDVPSTETVVSGAPFRLPSTFPAIEIAERLIERGIAAELSCDAGAYLCNAVLYRSLLASFLETSQANCRATIVGFVHLPEDLGMPSCPLSWRKALRGGLDIVNLCRETWIGSQSLPS